jgi:hypothetical protein
MGNNSFCLKIERVSEPLNLISLEDCLKWKPTSCAAAPGSQAACQCQPSKKHASMPITLNAIAHDWSMYTTNNASGQRALFQIHDHSTTPQLKHCRKQGNIQLPAVISHHRATSS